MRKYNETKDAGRALNFTETVFPEIEKGDQDLVEIITEVKGTGKNIFVVEKERRTDRFTGDITEKLIGNPRPFSTVDFATAESDLVASLTSSFNFAKDGRSQMTVDSFAKFAESVELAGIDLRGIQTLGEYLEVSKIYGDFINNKPDALNDQFRNDVYNSMMDLFVAEGEEMRAMLAGFQENPQDSQQMLDDLMVRINNLAMRARKLAGTTDYNNL